MPRLLYDLIFEQAERRPQATAIVHRQQTLSYAELAEQVQAVARGLLALGLSRLERVAVYLPKRPETVSTLFGASLAGGAFVPINPLLKPEQVVHILKDCNVRILVTAPERAKLLAPVLAGCHDLHFLVLVDTTEQPAVHHLETLGWQTLLNSPSSDPGHH